ncbi:type II secretion system major pseudopilin GspG [Marinibaculum pumilum]|uniref:Type II secretion system core protein G n=1 Tax=Marinibaculum pumilum TaxID=1766165 RepID=A0ABV7L0W2_9PROT
MAFWPETIATAAAARRRRAPADGEAGYTILEVLVVITIIGLLIGLVAPLVLQQLGGARDSIAKESIQRMGTVLDLYNLDVGSYPSTEQGLQALLTKPQGVQNWNGPYLKGDGVPKDPWGHEFVYTSPTQRPGKPYDLCSYGSDGPGAPASDQICN